MPKADATELAPQKIGYSPPAWRRCAGAEKGKNAKIARPSLPGALI
jgi:hypothetical protein